MIRTVRIVGRGAVGLTMGRLFDQAQVCDFAFVCDENRRRRYEAEPVVINGTQQTFRLITPEDQAEKADLVLFACKSYSLDEAMEEAAPFIDDHTVLMSAINGISSEARMRKRFPGCAVIHAIAQKMDSCYDSRAQTLDFTQCGQLVFGQDDESLRPQADQVEALFSRCGVPFVRSEEIVLDQCRKLTANCGLNQICALYDAAYGDIAADPQLSALFRNVMEETRAVLAAWGHDPGQEALEDWVSTVSNLAPESMPSMAQDMKAGRPIELDLFSGTVLKIAAETATPAPLLQMLYDGLTEKMNAACPRA